jgi:hypothetical protein
MTVSRETHDTPASDLRLSVRVDRALKTQVRETTRELQRRGLRTSASELVVLLVAHGLRELPPDRLHDLIIEMRQEQAR